MRTIVASSHESTYFEVDELKQFLAPLERALPYTGGTHNLDDIREAVQSGQMQCWPGVESVVITEIVDTPQKRLLNFFLAAGNLQEIRTLYHTIFDWAKSYGCDSAVILGRHGWERTFLTRDEGWEKKLILYEKDLSNGKATGRPDGNDQQ